MCFKSVQKGIGSLDILNFLEGVKSIDFRNVYESSPIRILVLRVTNTSFQPVTPNWFHKFGSYTIV